MSSSLAPFAETFCLVFSFLELYLVVFVVKNMDRAMDVEGDAECIDGDGRRRGKDGAPAELESMEGGRYSDRGEGSGGSSAVGRAIGARCTERLSVVTAPPAAVVIAPELAERLARGAALSELQAAHLARRCAELQSEVAESRENDEVYHTPTSVAEKVTPDCPSGANTGDRPVADDPSPGPKRPRNIPPPLIPDSSLPPLPDDDDDDIAMSEGPSEPDLMLVMEQLRDVQCSVFRKLDGCVELLVEKIEHRVASAVMTSHRVIIDSIDRRIDDVLRRLQDLESIMRTEASSAQSEVLSAITEGFANQDRFFDCKIAELKKEVDVLKSSILASSRQPVENAGTVGPLYRPDWGDNESYGAGRPEKEPTPFVRPDRGENETRQQERSTPTFERNPTFERYPRRRTSPYGGGAFAMAEGGWKGSYEQLKLPVLPRPGGVHAWVYDVGLALSVASTCSDLEEIAWFREILGTGELELSDSQRFLECDLQLALTLKNQIEHSIEHENIRTELAGLIAVAGRRGEIVSGRKIARLVLNWTGSRDLDFSFEDLERIKLANENDVESFFARWKVVAGQLSGRVSDATLRNQLIDRLSTVKIFDVQIGIFEAMGEERVTHSAVLEACERIIDKRRRKEADAIKDDFLLGRRRAFVSESKPRKDPVPQNDNNISKAPYQRSESGARSASQSPRRQPTMARKRKIQMIKLGLCFNFNGNGCDNPNCEYKHEFLDSRQNL